VGVYAMLMKNLVCRGCDVLFKYIFVGMMSCRCNVSLDVRWSVSCVVVVFFFLWRGSCRGAPY
jgi:hypothetical protein